MTPVGTRRGPARTRLLGTFILHNLEEIAAFTVAPPLPDAVRALRLDPGWYRRDRFALATAILTVAVAGLTGSVSESRGRRSALLGAAAVGALIANSAGHLGRAALTASYNAGSASAPLLLAAGIDSLRHVRRNGGLSLRASIVAAALGAVASLPAIAASLAVSRVVLR